MRQTHSLFLKTSKTTTKQNGTTARLKKCPHILLVEYFPILQNYLAKIIFANLGYKTTIAKSSKKVLNLAPYGSFDLIFLNMGLPDINGLTLICELRALQELQGIYIPIIASFGTSHHLDDGLIKSCLTAGANKVFTGKNCEPEDFQNLFEAALRHHRKKMG